MVRMNRYASSASGIAVRLRTFKYIVQDPIRYTGPELMRDIFVKRDIKKIASKWPERSKHQI